jgi:hypothetical protein
MFISEDQPGLFQEPAEQSSEPRLTDALNGSGARVKNYVLDTNVLLHDPHSVYRFADNHVWIPIDVLGELDKFKNEQTERANARTVHRFLPLLQSKQQVEDARGQDPEAEPFASRSMNFSPQGRSKSCGFSRFSMTWRTPTI